MNYQTLEVMTEDHVMCVGLNRPHKLNAFNLQMLRELAEVYTDFESDE